MYPNNVHTHAHTHTRMHTHTLTHTHSHTLTHTHTHSHTLSHTYTHTHTHTHTQTQTHKHTLTQTQFFFTEKDVGQNCAEVCLPQLAELNSYVRMEVLQGELSEDAVKQFQVVVLTQSTFEEQRRLGDFCHANGIRFIIANTKGLFGYVKVWTKVYCPHPSPLSASLALSLGHFQCFTSSKYCRR